MAVDVVVNLGAVTLPELGSVDMVVNWLSFDIEGVAKKQRFLLRVSREERFGEVVGRIQ
jgi:hypothetical protein